VTGASRGIGEAIAESLAAEGARVATISRSQDTLDKLAARIGNRSFAVACDITSPDQVASASDQILQSLGDAPDILVNNAGLFAIRRIEETSVAEFQSIIATNLTAAFSLVHAFLPDMRRRGSGHVVTIGSVADRHIFAGNGAYSAAKYGARALHEVLREETRGSGIRATLIWPSAVDTDIWEPIHYLDSYGRPDRSSMLHPRSVASAVLFALTQPQEVNVEELRLSRS
jgi:NADP-dependent 3-hydroxy acid dehydrogenase YdfG